MCIPPVKVTKYDFHRSFINNGVDPELTNSSFVNVTLDETTRRISIEEFDPRRPTNPRLQFTCSLPEAFCENVLGVPTCIGARDNLYILQYKSKDSRFLKLLLADRETSAVRCFADSAMYLQKSFPIEGPLECLISPDCGELSFRFPFGLRTGTQILHSDVIRRSDRSLHVTDLCYGGIRDWKYHQMVYDPRCGSRIVSFTVNKTASVVNIKCKDFSGAQSDAEFAAVELGRDWDLANWSLSQCRAVTSRSGEIAALCCISSVRNGKQKLKLCMFDMNNFDVIYSYSDDVHLPDCKEQVFLWPSVCDTKLLLYTGYKVSIDGSEPVKYRQLAREFSLPKQINLQESCRAAILRNCVKNDLDSLGLPPRLLCYLHFRGK